MLFQVLLCGECYKDVYTQRRTNYPSFNTLYTFKCTRHTVTLYITSESHIELFLSHVKLGVFCYIMTI
jgi:hypothetical protein